MKRRIIRATKMLLAVLAILVCHTACSDVGALLDDKLEFVSNGDGTCYLSRAEGFYGKNAVIPETSPEGDTVIGIGDGAFAGSGTVGVIIPDGVRFIGARAFASCERLGSVELPRGLEAIGGRIFEGCSSLRALTVDEECVTYYAVGNCLIERESGVLVLGCGGSIIPDDGSVTSIGNGAFYLCRSLWRIAIPEGVKEIGDSAFYGCSAVTSITLPQSLTSIGAYAFDGCSALTKMEISQGITALKEGVFRNCSSLAEVILPDGLTSVVGLAFFGCELLVDPIFPDSLTSIGELAFYGCRSLIHMKFPKSLLSLGDGAFLYCDMLWGIKVDKENPVYRAETNCLIRRSDGVIILGTRGSKIPENEAVTAIGDRAFHGAMMLRSIRIPSNIKRVGREAFYGCYYLVDAVICGENTCVDTKAFYNCASLTDVYISAGVTQMGADVFGECPSLSRISLGADTVPDGWDAAWNGSAAEVAYSCKDIPEPKE